MVMLSFVLVALMLGAQPVLGATVTDDNIYASLAAAKTAADHEALAAYYQGKASKALDQAKAHEKMEKTYERWGSGKEQAQHSVHCKGLIKSYENLAASYQQLAKDHLEIAKGLAK
jgi:hypothetical protein